VRALHLHAPYGVNLTGRGNGFAAVIGLIGTLTLLLAIAAENDPGAGPAGAAPGPLPGGETLRPNHGTGA
jgi:hypothetical protein